MPSAEERLSGVRLKIERAKQHIIELNTAINTFFESGPYGVEPDPNPQTSDVFLRVTKATPVPLGFGLTVGDAIHNLRSALDHVAWQLVECGRGTPNDQTSFPIGETRKKYALALKRGKIKGVALGAQKICCRVQPYQSGDETLWNIHQLDIFDKHKLVITAASSIATVTYTPKGLIRGITSPKDPLVPLILGDILASIPRRLYERDDYQFAVQITFGEPEILRGQPVLETLQHMLNFVEALVGRFVVFLN